MNQRIPGPDDEALEVLLDAIETVDYIAFRALIAVDDGDMETVKRKLHRLRSLIRHNVIGLLGIKDGDDE